MTESTQAPSIEQLADSAARRALATLFTTDTIHPLPEYSAIVECIYPDAWRDGKDARAKEEAEAEALLRIGAAIGRLLADGGR